MAQYDVDKTIDALAIRDTSDHTSVVSNHQQFAPKTIAVCNKLDKSVDFQLQGCFDESFTEAFDIGAVFNVAANTNDWQNAEVYFPFLRIVATATVTPTSGTLTVFFLKRE